MKLVETIFAECLLLLGTAFKRVVGSYYPCKFNPLFTLLQSYAIVIPKGIGIDSIWPVKINFGRQQPFLFDLQRSVNLLSFHSFIPLLLI